MTTSVPRSAHGAINPDSCSAPGENNLDSCSAHSATARHTGCLFLLVGPSGAGKDSLLSVARQHFGAAVSFPRRVITRPADAGGENHIALGPDDFAAARAQWRFAFDWTAHGLDYGIEQTINSDLAGGVCVVVNVSRTVIEQARQRYNPVRVLSVTVTPAELARRLRARGREDDAAIEQRLARAFTVTGPDVINIDNSGPLDLAARQVIAAIEPFIHAGDSVSATQRAGPPRDHQKDTGW